MATTTVLIPRSARAGCIRYTEESKCWSKNDAGCPDSFQTRPSRRWPTARSSLLTTTVHATTAQASMKCHTYCEQCLFILSKRPNCCFNCQFKEDERSRIIHLRSLKQTWMGDQRANADENELKTSIKSTQLNCSSSNGAVFAGHPQKYL